MNFNQKQYIIDNFDELVRNTDCHSLFFAFLESKKVLEASDVGSLQAYKNRLTKSRKFYELVITREDSFEILLEALQNTQQTGALNILEGYQIVTKSIRYDVRQPVHLFTGREEELSKLHQHLKHDHTEKTATLITQTASITGLGGIGKTELCRRYIKKYSDEYDGNVIWIGAEKPENMATSFKSLAKDILQISLKDADGDEKDIKTVVDEVYNYFQSKKCLFVFDNAMSSRIDELQVFLPNRVLNKPNILISSRDNIWDIPFHVLMLEELKEHEAIEFVKKGLMLNNDDDQHDVIIQLVTRLQRFPLALQQAISYIREQQLRGGFEIKDYLQSFEEQNNLLLDHQVSSFLSNKYTKTTFTTWKVTTEVIEADKENGTLAMNILHMIAYVEPDKIPSELLLRHENLEEDMIHSALQLLVKYSMMNCQPTKGLFNIHRLVQEVTRIQLRCSNKEETSLKNTLQLFQLKYEDLKNISTEVDHAMSAFDFASQHPNLVRQFSQLPSKIIEMLNFQSRRMEARAYVNRPLNILRRHLPDESIDIIGLEVSVAGLEDHAEKRYLARKAGLEKYETHEQTEKLQVMIKDIKSSMFKCLLLLGKISEAFKILSEFLPKSTLTEIIKDVNSTKEMVAIIMMTINEKFEQSWLENKTSENWTEFWMIVEFAKYLSYNNQYELSYPIWMKLYNICGDLESIGWAIRRAHVTEGLANVVENHVGDDETTLKLLNGICGEKDSYDHVAVNLPTYSAIAEIMAKQQNFPEAIEYATKVNEYLEKAYGVDNAETLDSLSFLAGYKREAGMQEEALDIHQNVHHKLSSLLGEVSPNTMAVKFELLLSLLDNEAYEQALKLGLEIYKIIMETDAVETRIEFEDLDVLWSMAYTLNCLKTHGSSLALCYELDKQANLRMGRDIPKLISYKMTLVKDIKFAQFMLTFGESRTLEFAESDYAVFKSERERLNSFMQTPSWKVPFIRAEDLAEAGFFFLKVKDEVQCAFCRGRVHAWEEGDSPRDDHKKHFWFCPFINNLPVGNVSIHDPPPALDQNGPTFPTLDDFDLRLTTFTNWPKNAKLSPQDMAVAGFFYVGSKEDVACFYCGGGFIKIWSANDDPCIEHTSYFPHCSYMNRLKIGYNAAQLAE